jgi:hypothetical protein
MVALFATMTVNTILPALVFNEEINNLREATFLVAFFMEINIYNQDGF